MSVTVAVVVPMATALSAHGVARAVKKAILPALSFGIRLMCDLPRTRASAGRKRPIASTEPGSSPPPQSSGDHDLKLDPPPTSGNPRRAPPARPPTPLPH